MTRKLFDSAAKHSNGSEKERLHAQTVVERVINQHIDLTSDYDRWVELGFAFASLGEEGRPLFHRVSCLHEGYDMDDCDAKFTNCMKSSRNQVGIATFYHLAEQAGVDISLPAELRPRRGRPRRKGSDENAEDDAPTKFHLAEEKLREMAQFRYNEITRKTEMRHLTWEGVPDGDWMPIDDRNLNSLFVGVCKEHISITKENLHSIIDNPDFTPSYNPFIDYLEHLPEWDATNDYIAQLFSFITFAGGDAERDFCMPLLRKWFIRLVALLVGRADDNQLMPVLVGPPHAGKTYFCTHLLPPSLRSYAKVVYPNERLDKDTLISINEKGLLIFDEFKNDSRTANTLRAIITSASIDVRAPFAHFSESRTRVASFIGSCNDEQYIPEPDGNRRYLSVPVAGTVTFTDDTLPLEQAYAQAWHTIKSGHADDYTLTISDTRRIEQHNVDYTTPNLCEELLAICYRTPTDDEQGRLVPFGEIINKLRQLNNSSEVNAKNVGTALKHRGFQKRKTKQCNRWYVMEITFDENRMEAVNEGHRMYAELHPDSLSADAGGGGVEGCGGVF
jgi:predicted P-loop ATPase